MFAICITAGGQDCYSKHTFHKPKHTVCDTFSQFSLSPLSLSPPKSEDSVTITSGISMSYSSSTDDTSSLGTPSTIPQPSAETSRSDPLLPESPRATPVSGETEEEERKDRLTEVPERSAMLPTSMRSLSPFRRHSWGPGKNSAGEVEMSQRRYGSPTYSKRS